MKSINGVGSFLVRESESRPTDFSLSGKMNFISLVIVLLNNDIKHNYKINHVDSLDLKIR